LNNHAPRERGCRRITVRILIIGGTKFIGPYVVRELVGHGYDVTVFHRGQTEADLPSAVRHVRDASASIPVLSFPPEVLDPMPDVVIHMVPMGERDATAAVDTFRDRARRLIALSSGDVYRAYCRFTGLEAGPIERGLLVESSPLRSVMYPYRKQAQSSGDWVYSYEKILVERVIAQAPQIETVILRLPKVYGPGENADLATVYGFRHQPQWRWTHGYVENVAHAIALAAIHPSAAGIYNVGEAYTPTMGERLALLPPSDVPLATMPANFEQDIVYDTTRIRRELGFVETVDDADGLRRTLASNLPK
jgi:nucleoside-diphosphate-sugar epimerase